MKKTFFSACIVYLIIAVLIFPYLQWYADNPDTFQYLSIAHKYLSGDWSHAVNGYWSPLISWLLASPLLILNNDLLAFKILQFLIGGFALFQWGRLIDYTSLQRRTKNILCFVAIPFLLDYALLNATPDLLFLTLSLYLINLTLRGNIFSDKHMAIKIGLAGGLLFLTKSFGFPFFIAVISILLFVELKMKHPVKRKNIFTIYLTFFIISSIWIIPLSLHYNHLTIGEAASFNLSRDVAPLPDRGEELPILGKGLYLPKLHSYSAWENPGEYVSKECITLLNSPGEYLQIIKRNLLTIYYYDFRNQIGIIFFLLLLVFIWKKGIKNLFKEKWIVISLLFILLIYAGYSLILVHTRYVWINTLLMIALSVYFIQSIFDSEKLKTVSLILSVTILLIAVKRPVKEILFTSDNKVPAHWIYKALTHPFQTMWINYRPDRNLHRTMTDLKSKKVAGGNIASLKTDWIERDPYTSSMRIANSLSCNYLGQLDNEMSIQQQDDELTKMNVDYLITWGNVEWEGGELLYFNLDSGMRVYELR